MALVVVVVVVVGLPVCTAGCDPLHQEKNRGGRCRPSANM